MNDHTNEFEPDIGDALNAFADGVDPPAADRPTISVTADEFEVNAAAANALGGLGTVYARGSALVQAIAEAKDTDSTGLRRPAGSLLVQELGPGAIRSKLSQAARFVKIQPGNGGELVEKPDHVPAWTVHAVVSDASLWGLIPRLDAVVPHPVLSPDGVTLLGAGYSRQLRAFVDPGDVRLDLPDRPTRSDARAAVDLICKEMLGDFPFQDTAHRSGFLSVLLTPLAWFMFDGPAPFHLVDANAAGTGKGLLLDVGALTLIGRSFTCTDYHADRVELEKRITAVVRSGDRFCLFDNLSGAVGNAMLDAALTSRTWGGRILGKSEMIALPANVLWLGTGNNIELRADTARRTLHVRMESNVESPEQRTDFRHPDLRRHVLEHRGTYLGAALTVLRAWSVAGRPTVDLSTWGSFEGWSSVVRQALVWVGEPDPAQTRSQLRDRSDRDRGALLRMLEAIRRIDPKGRGVTAGQLIRLAEGDRPFSPTTSYGKRSRGSGPSSSPAHSATNLGPRSEQLRADCSSTKPVTRNGHNCGRFAPHRNFHRQSTRRRPTRVSLVSLVSLI